MIGVDTNLLLYALHAGVGEHAAARAFMMECGTRQDVVMSELVLVELYVLLRNAKVFGREVPAAEAAGVVQRFRHNPNWMVVENAPVMDEVWAYAARPGFARRRLFDVRLALTLQHHGVTRFATANVRDFEGLGFEKVWNPLEPN
ncbi:TA system VapC family ribonuclease toxin [Sulfuriroseicoccus oceanibius]|uniref:Ribonuclease VapC n=1 Tax=Sulfuriroseicoccus oceanibius TaxID=2707525 RepID=A0A6B3L2Z3_9BACT|nr:TA system VapC family ribonuclease toxin [Sulfuriroseicoccus oceanibius]QQL46209.1 PIN domain-containing protein [Sulfuriroseicoccus oceanibius]